MNRIRWAALGILGILAATGLAVAQESSPAAGTVEKIVPKKAEVLSSAKKSARAKPAEGSPVSSEAEVQGGRVKPLYRQLEEARNEADLDTPEGRREWRRKKKEIRKTHRDQIEKIRAQKAEAAKKAEEKRSDPSSRSYVERNKEKIVEEMKNFKVYGTRNSNESR